MAARTKQKNKRAPVIETKSGIDLAPMVDIIFLLLAYFLINSTLAKTPAIRIDLPQSESASYVSEEAIEVLVQKDGVLLVNGSEVPLESLAAQLQNARAGSGANAAEVSIRGDAGVEYQRVISVIDQVQKAGIQDFHLTTVQSR